MKLSQALPSFTFGAAAEGLPIPFSPWCGPLKQLQFHCHFLAIIFYWKIYFFRVTKPTCVWSNFITNVPLWPQK